MDKLDRLAFEIKVLTTKALTETDPSETLERISELAAQALVLATNANAARR